MTDLSFAGTHAALTTSHIRATSTCRETFVPPASLVQSAPAPLLASSSGVSFSSGELSTWRARAVTGPFVQPGDYKSGTPGDWQRISTNAYNLVQRGEPLGITSNPDSRRASHGTQARDAAFYALITGDASVLAAVRSHLLTQAANPVNDFAGSLCFRMADGTGLDAWFSEASWLLRHMVAYDYVRASIGAADRLRIENWLRRNAYFLAAHLDWGMATVFPRRHEGDYLSSSSAAAARSADAVYIRQRQDTNNDCRVDSADDPTEFYVYAYTRADGTVGPRLSVLSQFFNNRKAVVSAAVGFAGVLLDDAQLVYRAKRYTMEWLTFGVYADGAEGEYHRNGEYCIPKQGIIYASSTVQSAMLMGSALARQGDQTLYNFRTAQGRHGSEGVAGVREKSIALVANTHLKLLSRQLPWYMHEPWRSRQVPREDTFLGKVQSRYLNSCSETENIHELGMIIGARYLSTLPVVGMALRDPAVTSLPFPGSTGNAVTTGLGSMAGVWTDAMNAYPSMFLLRP